jgi:glycosyltransferase involved in cell wall biosynthesis
MIKVKDLLKDQKVLKSASAPSSPAISVILPTYSRYKTGSLERAVNSVLAQDFEDFEFLIMDDGSSDGSSEFIEKIRAGDPRVIHVRHEHNCGLPALRVNEGIELSKGQYIAFQFDDDLWKRTALTNLLAEHKRHSEPVAVIGRATFSTKIGQGILPEKEVDIVDLYETNRFANNSIMLPRSIMEKYGMYDPHIGMRRLTDWDLWIRLIKHLPFITIDKTVSQVFESNIDAIGVTVPWDISLFRFINNINRDPLLTPANWREFEIDSLSIAGVAVRGEIGKRLYEEQIVPYYFKMRHLFPQLGGFPATDSQSPPKEVLFTKGSYDVSNDVTFNNYDPLTSRRNSFKSYYQSIEETTLECVSEADLLLLMRTVEDDALNLTDKLTPASLPVGYYLDDDLFSFHEYGSEFDYLAPDSHYYNNLTSITKQVDAVLVTNDFIRESVQPINPRIVPHNNTIPDEYISHENLHARNDAQLRIGYVGTGYRIEEFRQIWDAFIRISQDYKEKLLFEFWGIEIGDLPKLSSPVVQKAFTFSYQYYLQSLQNAEFDILLTPLLDYPKPRLGKSLIKYYETAVAGALGIFSDVPQYRTLPGGLTCLKSPNDPQSWYDTLRKAIEMDPVEFDAIRERCIAHVREEYGVHAQIDLHEAALRAIEFHAKTDAKRADDGQPRVMYFLHSAHYGGAEIQLWRRLRLMKNYGIQPIVVIPSVLVDSESGVHISGVLEEEGIQLESVEYTCFTEPRSPKEFDSELERNQIQALFERCDPALVHSVTFIPSLGQVCTQMGIPHVNTLYAVEDDFAWASGQPGFKHCDVVQSDCLRYAKRWSYLLGAQKIVSRDTATEGLFQLGQTKYLKTIGSDSADFHETTRLIATGTFQERKQQLETIEALGALKKEGFNFELNFYGYTHFFPDYVVRCKKAIESLDLSDSVFINEFTEDIDQVLSEVDILVSLSKYESFPGSIKDAFAAGILVAATPVGGVSELIIDNVSGILCRGTSVEDLADGMRRALSLSRVKRAAIAEHGRKIGRLELHHYRTANDLFRMYNMALDLNASDRQIMYLTKPTAGIQVSSPDSSVRGKSPTGHPTSLMPIGAGIVYDFIPQQQHWTGIDVLVETNKRASSGKLTLSVCAADGKELRAITKNMKHFSSGWLELRFTPINNSEDQEFQLEFSLKDSHSGTLLSLYQNSPPKHKFIRMMRRFLRIIGIKLRGEQLYCREWYS